MTDELRERLIDVAWDTHNPAREIPELQSMAKVVDAILNEIAAAGYEVVERERLERYRASHAVRYQMIAEHSPSGSELRKWALESWYKDGDLEVPS